MNELFYKNTYLTTFEATVIECREDKNGYAIVLDDTAFYPEGGGQPCDTGYLDNTEVLSVKRKEDKIYHYTNAPLEINTKVTGKINWERRFDHMQQHSGEHVFSGLVHKNYGYENIGFHMGDSELILDFSGPLTWEEIMNVEKQANAYIAKNVEVKVTYPSKEELDQLEYRSKKELTGIVRIVEFEGADRCACCGTHVKQSGEIQMIKVLSCINKKGGTRVEIICGNRAITYMDHLYDQARILSQKHSVKPYELDVALARLENENDQLKQALNLLKQNYITNKLKELPFSDKTLILIENTLSANDIRKLANDIVENKKAATCAILIENNNGYNYVVVSKVLNLREAAKNISRNCGGKGGGSNEMIQGTIISLEPFKQLLGE